jgi:histidyl-tRNA synthetase
MAAPGESFEPGLSLFIATLGDKARTFVLPIAQRLRLAGIRTEIEHREIGLKSQLKRADALRARLALIVGDDELARGKLVLRDLTRRQQSEVAVDEIEARVREAMD